jgi:hypothetical protein
MPESAFEGTVLEGRERRYTIINERDLKNYCSGTQIDNLNKSLNEVLTDIELGRLQDGKNLFNSYIVINLDEPYIDEIIGVMKRHGHMV